MILHGAEEFAGGAANRGHHGSYAAIVSDVATAAPARTKRNPQCAGRLPERGFRNLTDRALAFQN